MYKIKHREIYDFYHRYTWEKCSYMNFYQRVLISNIPIERAILPQKFINRKARSPARKFREEYKGKKIGLQSFLNRLYVYKLSFEEAINPNRLKKSITHINKNPYLIKKTHVKVENQISYIDITLKPEEASIFRRAYSRMLSELESDLEFCEIPSDVPIITAKIKQLKEEIRVFNLYN